MRSVRECEIEQNNNKVNIFFSSGGEKIRLQNNKNDWTDWSIYLNLLITFFNIFQHVTVIIDSFDVNPMFYHKIYDMIKLQQIKMFCLFIDTYIFGLKNSPLKTKRI